MKKQNSEKQILRIRTVTKQNNEETYQQKKNRVMLKENNEKAEQ